MNVVSDLDAGFRLEAWEVHPDQNRLAGPAGEIHLTPRCMDILVLLAERAGEVVQRDDFNERIWHPAVVTDDALTRHISTLRQALGDEIGQPKFIETIPKRGYRLVAPVEPLEPSTTATGPGHTPATSSDDGDERLGRNRHPVRRQVLLSMLLVVVSLLALSIHVPRELPSETSPSIAVLPFEVFGTTGDFPLIDGLHHDLLTRLSHIEDLRVISRTSVKRYQDTMLPIGDIARELGVAWIVEGAVQQVGDEIQLNAQLIDTARDTHVWARTYRRELTARNLFSIQQEIVEDIADSLAARLDRRKETRLDTIPTHDLESYTLYVQGRTHLDRRTETGMSGALVFFHEALEHDPDYALAWVGLTDALTLLHDYGYRDADSVLPQAEAAIERALELDPQLAEAHASLGLLHSTRRRGPDALAALQRAVELRPGYAEAHNWISWNSLVLGLPEQAWESARRATELNPHSPEAISNLILSLVVNNRLDQAIEQAERIRTLGLSFSTDRFYKGLAQYQAGHYRAAIDTLQDIEAAWARGGPQAVLAMAWIAEGEPRRAESLLQALEDRNDRFSMAMVHAALGEEQRASELLDSIEQWHYWSALALHHFMDTLLADLARTPGFRDRHAAMRAFHGLPPAEADPSALNE